MHVQSPAMLLCIWRETSERSNFGEPCSSRPKARSPAACDDMTAERPAPSPRAARWGLLMQTVCVPSSPAQAVSLPAPPRKPLPFVLADSSQPVPCPTRRPGHRALCAALLVFTAFAVSRLCAQREVLGGASARRGGSGGDELFFPAQAGSGTGRRRGGLGVTGSGGDRRV